MARSSFRRPQAAKSNTPRQINQTGPLAAPQPGSENRLTSSHPSTAKTGYAPNMQDTAPDIQAAIQKEYLQANQGNY